MNSDQVISDLATIKCTLLNHEKKGDERQAAADTFRGQALADNVKIADQQRVIIEQQRVTNGRVTALERDAVKWRDILPNSKNWKFYAVAVLLLVGTRIGADFIKLFLSTLLKISL